MDNESFKTRRSIQNGNDDGGDDGDDGGDDDGDDDDVDDGDDDGGDDGDEMGKIRKSKFPKVVRKSLKTKRKMYNRETSKNQFFI